MSRLEWTALCLGLFLVQGSVMPLLLNGLWQPDLWLVTVIIAVLAYDRKTALSFAVVGGIAQDIVTGNFFGLHLFPYLMAALLTAFFMRERYNRKWLVSVLSAAAGTAVYLVFVGAVVTLAGGRVEIPAYALHSALPQIAANVAAAVFLHPLLWNMKREWEPRW